MLIKHLKKCYSSVLNKCSPCIKKINIVINVKHALKIYLQDINQKCRMFMEKIRIKNSSHRFKKMFHMYETNISDI